VPAASPHLDPTPGQSAGGTDAGPVVLASNRLPIRWDDDAEQWVRSSGGLVAALEPVMAGTGGVWVGWADGPEPPARQGFGLSAVDLDPPEVDGYYAGFANSTLWPAFHDAIEPVEHRDGWWECYRRVNRRFAGAIAEVAPPGAAVWVNDYHLCLVPRLVRELRPDVRIGFFLHTPWPALSVASQVPHIDELMAGMEGADLIGFQRARDEARFRALRSNRHAGPGPVAQLGVFPISVDAPRWTRLAGEPVVQARARRLRSAVGDGRRLLIGVDRMDYSKGIPERLEALDRLLSGDRFDPDRVRMLQVAVPSRQAIPAYRRLRDRVVAKVRDLNRRFGAPGDPVVVLQEDAASPRELAALYLAADVALVTPRRDGMNLVAKEFCAVQGADRPGVLVLGRDAGAADELHDAVLVDGSDPASVADGMERALALGPLARQELAARLRRGVHQRDLARWTSSYLDALRAAGAAAAVRGSSPGRVWSPDGGAHPAR
jgi:trehalose 6-phosphate synthase